MKYVKLNTFNNAMLNITVYRNLSGHSDWNDKRSNNFSKLTQLTNTGKGN
jgi:hypothetical protein